MLLQLSGDDILIQFLNKNCLLILIDLNDTIDFTVNVVFEHRLNLHVVVPSLNHVKRTVIRIRRQFIKQRQIATIAEVSWVHDQHGYIRKMRLHRI